MSENFSLGKNKASNIDFSRIKSGVKKDEIVKNNDMLKSIFDMVDTNHNKILDRDELDKLRQEIAEMAGDDNLTEQEVKNFKDQKLDNKKRNAFFEFLNNLNEVTPDEVESVITKKIGDKDAEVVKYKDGHTEELYPDGQKIVEIVQGNKKTRTTFDKDGNKVEETVEDEQTITNSTFENGIIVEKIIKDKNKTFKTTETYKNGQLANIQKIINSDDKWIITNNGVLISTVRNLDDKQNYEQQTFEYIVEDNPDNPVNLDNLDSPDEPFIYIKVTTDSTLNPDKKIIDYVIDADINGNYDNSQIFSRETTTTVDGKEITTNLEMNEGLIYETVSDGITETINVYSGCGIKDFDKENAVLLAKSIIISENESYSVGYDGNGNTYIPIKNGEGGERFLGRINKELKLAGKPAITMDDLKRLNPTVKDWNNLHLYSEKRGTDGTLLIPGIYEPDSDIVKNSGTIEQNAKEGQETYIKLISDRLSNKNIEEYTITKSYSNYDLLAKELGVDASELRLCNINSDGHYTKLNTGTKIYIPVELTDKNNTSQTVMNKFDLKGENRGFYFRYNKLEDGQKSIVDKYIQANPNKTPKEIKDGLLMYHGINLFDSGLQIPLTGNNKNYYLNSDPYTIPEMMPYNDNVYGGNSVSLETFIEDYLKLDLNSESGKYIYDKMSETAQKLIELQAMRGMKVTEENYQLWAKNAFAYMSASDFNNNGSNFSNLPKDELYKSLCNHGLPSLYLINNEINDIQARARQSGEFYNLLNNPAAVNPLFQPQKHEYTDEEIQDFAGSRLYGFLSQASKDIHAYYDSIGYLSGDAMWQGVKKIVDDFTLGYAVETIWDEMNKIDNLLSLAKDLNNKKMSSDEFNEKFKSLTGIAYNKENIEKFKQIYDQNILTLPENMPDEYYKTGEAAFGNAFTIIKNTQKSVSSQQSKGQVCDVVMMFAGTGELNTLSKATKIPYYATKYFGKTGSFAVRGAANMATWTTVQGGVNLATRNADVTKEDLVAYRNNILISSGFGAVGGFWGKVATTPAMNFTSKYGNKFVQKILPKETAKQLSNTTQKVSKIFEKQETASAAEILQVSSRTSTFAGYAVKGATHTVGFATEVIGFTTYQTTFDIVASFIKEGGVDTEAIKNILRQKAIISGDKELLDAVNGDDISFINAFIKLVTTEGSEQIKSLGELKGISGLMKFIAGGRNAMNPIDFSNMESLNNIKVKKTNYKGKKPFYEIEFPDGKKAVANSEIDLINICQVEMNKAYVRSTVDDLLKDKKTVSGTDILKATGADKQTTQAAKSGSARNMYISSTNNSANKKVESYKITLPDGTTKNVNDLYDVVSEVYSQASLDVINSKISNTPISLKDLFSSNKDIPKKINKNGVEVDIQDLMNTSSILNNIKISKITIDGKEVYQIEFNGNKSIANDLKAVLDFGNKIFEAEIDAAVTKALVEDVLDLEKSSTKNPSEIRNGSPEFENCYFSTENKPNEVTDFDLLCMLGEVNGQSQVFTKEFRESRGIKVLEENGDLDGLNYKVYQKGEEIILVVDGYHGSKGNVQYGASNALENIGFNKNVAKFITFGIANNKQIKTLEKLYSKWSQQCAKDGKKFSMTGYSMGGNQVRAIANKYNNDNTTRFVVFNELANANNIKKNNPRVKSYAMDNDPNNIKFERPVNCIVIKTERQGAKGDNSAHALDAYRFATEFEPETQETVKPDEIKIEPPKNQNESPKTEEKPETKSISERVKQTLEKIPGYNKLLDIVNGSPAYKFCTNIFGNIVHLATEPIKAGHKARKEGDGFKQRIKKGGSAFGQQAIKLAVETKDDVKDLVGVDAIKAKKADKGTLAAVGEGVKNGTVGLATIGTYISTYLTPLVYIPGAVTGATVIVNTVLSKLFKPYKPKNNEIKGSSSEPPTKETVTEKTNNQPNKSINIDEFSMFNNIIETSDINENLTKKNPTLSPYEGQPVHKEPKSQPSSDYNKILDMIKNANSRKDFGKIRDELKKLPLGEERDALIKAQREKYQNWSRNSAGRNVVNLYVEPKKTNSAPEYNGKLSSDNFEKLKNAFQNAGMDIEQAIDNSYDWESTIKNAEKWYEFDINGIVDDTEVVNSIVDAYKIKGTNIEDIIINHSVSSDGKTYNLFDGFSLSPFEINQLYLAVKTKNVNNVRAVLQKNNPQIYEQLNIKGFYDSDKFSTHIHELNEILPDVEHVPNKKTCNIGYVNGKKLSIDCPNDNLRTKIEKGAFYQTKGKTNVYNTKTLLQSNLITREAIQALKQSNIDYSNQTQGSRFAVTGEKIQLSIGEIIQKYEKYGLDSLTPRETHALTDYLDNLYDKNDVFKNKLDNIVRNNQSVSNLRASLAAIRKEVDAKLSNSNITVDDHFICRIVDRNHLNILNVSNNNFKIEFIQAIEQNPLVKALNNGSECEIPITVDNKNYTVKVKKEDGKYNLVTII